MKLIVTHEYFAKHREEIHNFVKNEEDVVVTSTGLVGEDKPDHILIDDIALKSAIQCAEDTWLAISKAPVTVEKTEDDGYIYREYYKKGDN